MKHAHTRLGSLVGAIALLTTATPAFSQSAHTAVSGDGSHRRLSCGTLRSATGSFSRSRGRRSQVPFADAADRRHELRYALGARTGAVA